MLSDFWNFKVQPGLTADTAALVQRLTRDGEKVAEVFYDAATRGVKNQAAIISDSIQVIGPALTSQQDDIVRSYEEFGNSYRWKNTISNIWDELWEWDPSKLNDNQIGKTFYKGLSKSIDLNQLQPASPT